MAEALEKGKSVNPSPWSCAGIRYVLSVALTVRSACEPSTWLNPPNGAVMSPAQHAEAGLADLKQCGDSRRRCAWGRGLGVA